MWDFLLFFDCVVWCCDFYLSDISWYSSNFNSVIYWSRMANKGKIKRQFMSDMTANLSVTVKHNKGHNTSYLSDLWRDFQVMSQSFVKATARSTYTDDVLVWLRSNLKKLVSLTFPFTVCIVASYYSYTSRQKLWNWWIKETHVQAICQNHFCWSSASFGLEWP